MNNDQNTNNYTNNNIYNDYNQKSNNYDNINVNDNQNANNIGNNMYTEYNQNTNNNANNQSNNGIYTTYEDNKQQGYKQEEKPYIVMSDKEVKDKRKQNKYLSVFVYGIFFIVAGIIYYMYQLDKNEFYIGDKEITVATGSSYQVEIIPKNANVFKYENYVYKMEDENVATVDEYGKVTAVGEGTTRLKIKYKNGIEYKTMQIRTENIEVSKIKLKEVEGNKEGIKLNVNESTQLEAEANDREDVKINVKYRSSDEEVAEVDEHGNVIAVGEGEATIIGESSDGTTGETQVVVEKPVVEVESIDIEETSIVLQKGSIGKIIAKVSPENADNKTLTYQSENSNVRVDNNGNITGINTGESLITITSNNGKKAYCTVIVKEEKIEVEAIDIDYTRKEIKQGEVVQLEATVIPENATNREIVWSSSNTSIAKVEKGKVTGIGIGEATIIASTKDGKVKDSCKIVVKTNKVEVTGIKIGTSKIPLKVGQKANIQVIVEPNNATDKKLTYTSNNNNIIVDATGLIQAKKVGKSIVTITTSNGKKATVEVEVTENSIEVSKITLNKTNIKLNLGASEQINVNIEPSNATIREIKWTSSNTNIVSVNNGKITAKGSGTATITAKSANGKTATCKVTVEVPVTGIKLSGVKTIKVGQTAQIDANISPSNASNKQVTWKSSNPNIIFIDLNGIIVGKSVGTASITATTNNGLVAKKSIVVEKNDIAVTSARVKPTSVEIKEGEKVTLSVVVEPSNATDKKVTWTSSDTKIATVANGKVTGIKAGKVTITAKTNNGKSGSSVVTIKKGDILATGISFKNNETTTINIGASTNLSVTISPSNVTNKTITWTSSDTKIATVSSGKVTGIKAGSVVITAKTSNGKTATHKVIVRSNIVDVSSIKLNKTSTTIKIKDSVNLNATVNPSNATNQDITWKSSNTKIVKVSSNGKVTGVGIGTATITAKSNNGKTATCKVTVDPYRIMFIGTSSTYYNMYREFVVNIATSKGYIFYGSQPESYLNTYWKSGNYFNKNINYSNKNVKNSYYSYTMGAGSRSDCKSALDCLEKDNREKYNNALSKLKIDFLIVQNLSGNNEANDEVILNIIKKNNPNVKMIFRLTALSKDKYANKKNINDIIDKKIEAVKSYNSKGVSTKAIYDANIAYKVYNEIDKNIFFEEKGHHPTYLATYAYALALNKVLFNIDPTTVSYVPDILQKDKYKNVSGSTYKGGYPTCQKNPSSSCKKLEKEQTYVETIKKIVKNTDIQNKIK